MDSNRFTESMQQALSRHSTNIGCAADADGA
jgi:hypothetical protein